MKQTESQLQRAVAKVLDASGLLWCHVPNGGNRDARTGAKLKAEGVKPGVPDLLVFDTPDPLFIGSRCGVAIELKVGKNKLTLHQSEWHKKMRKRLWHVVVCYSLDEVLAVLRECYPHKFK